MIEKLFARAYVELFRRLVRMEYPVVGDTDLRSVAWFPDEGRLELEDARGGSRIISTGNSDGDLMSAAEIDATSLLQSAGKKKGRSKPPPR